MRRDTFLAFAVVLLVLAALAAKSLLISVPPVRAHDGPAQFDAVRAKARLARILADQRPHPADSAGDDAVRARLVAELRAMGLKPIVRDQMACNDFQKARLVACSRVRNVIAQVGPSNGKALLLSAHYDSVPAGPGAGDDGIGGATLIEVASILKDKPLKRPVIFLFNEGEELGLVGARAFLADPLSRQVDSVLNFDARGDTGPAMMFETSGAEGAAMSAFARSAPHPNASSLSTDLARLIPNDTDMTVYKERGWVGLNFGVIGNETRYHSPGDDLAALDTGSVQHMGDQALALASDLSGGAPAAQGPRIFVDLFGRVLVQLPMIAGAMVLALLLLCFGAIAWKRGAIVRGPAVALGAMLAGGLVAYLATVLMGALRPGIYWRAHPEIAFTAIYATILLGELGVLRTAGAKLEPAQLRAGSWFLFLLIGALLAIVAPGAMIYFLFPPLAVLIGIALGRRNAVAEMAGALVGLLLLYISWGELLGGLEELFSPGPLWMVVPAAAIVILPALVEARPLVSGVPRRPLLLGSAAIALAAWAVTAATPAYSGDHQQRFTIEHVTDVTSGKSYWSILDDGAALPAAYQAAGPWHRSTLPYSERMRWLAPAPAIGGLHSPSIELIEAVRNGNERALRLRLHANGAERISIVAPEQAHLHSAGIGQSVRPIDASASSGKFTIACVGRSCDGAELSLDMDGGPQPLTIVGSRNGLPPFAAPFVRARPRFARPQYTPDETVTMATVTL